MADAAMRWTAAHVLERARAVGSLSRGLLTERSAPWHRHEPLAPVPLPSGDVVSASPGDDRQADLRWQ
jgi:hypothetical protein